MEITRETGIIWHYYSLSALSAPFRMLWFVLNSEYKNHGDETLERLGKRPRLLFIVFLFFNLLYVGLTTFG